MVLGLLTVVVVSIALLVAGNPVPRLVVGLLFLFLPGWALTAALFPPGSLEGPARLLLSLALSLTVAVPIGFVLNWTPWGLQPVTWATALLLITLAAGAVARARQRERPPDSTGWYRTELEQVRATIVQGHWEAAVSQLEGLAAREAGPRPALTVRQGLALACAVVLGGAAIGLARVGAAEAPTPGFTQLWLWPTDDPGDAVMQIGIRNLEPAATTYRLRLARDGAVFQEWLPITLQPGTSWETRVLLPAAPPGGEVISAVLNRVDNPTIPYRQVHRWRSSGQE